VVPAGAGLRARHLPEIPAEDGGVWGVREEGGEMSATERQEYPMCKRCQTNHAYPRGGTGLCDDCAQDVLRELAEAVRRIIELGKLIE
jgi:hypothetical protein